VKVHPKMEVPRDSAVRQLPILRETHFLWAEDKLVQYIFNIADTGPNFCGRTQLSAGGLTFCRRKPHFCVRVSSNFAILHLNVCKLLCDGPGIQLYVILIFVQIYRHMDSPNFLSRVS